MKTELDKKTANHYNIKSCGIAKAAIKDVDTKSRTVTGVLNTYNFVDHGMDVLLPGCCKRSINDNGPASNAAFKIKHALNHNMSQLPGKIITLEEREIDTENFGKITGLYFESKMSTSTLGDDTLKMYLEEIYDNHSIGFQYMKAEKVERDGQHGNSTAWKKSMEQMYNPQKAEEYGYFYAIKEIKLFEGSTVAQGMNELTPYLGVKGKEDYTLLQVESRIDKLDSMLKTGTISDEAMQIIQVEFLQLKQIYNDVFSKLSVTDQRERVIDPPTPESFNSKLAGLFK